MPSMHCCQCWLWLFWEDGITKLGSVKISKWGNILTLPAKVYSYCFININGTTPSHPMKQTCFQAVLWNPELSNTAKSQTSAVNTDHKNEVEWGSSSQIQYSALLVSEKSHKSWDLWLVLIFFMTTSIFWACKALIQSNLERAIQKICPPSLPVVAYTVLQDQSLSSRRKKWECLVSF